MPFWNLIKVINCAEMASHKETFFSLVFTSRFTQQPLHIKCKWLIFESPKASDVLYFTGKEREYADVESKASKLALSITLLAHVR